MTQTPRLEMRYGAHAASIIALNSPGICKHDRYGAIAVSTRDAAPELEAIVRACNSHDELLAALELLRNAFDQYYARAKPTERAAYDQAGKTIARAKGEA